MAATVIDLLSKPELVQAAKEEAPAGPLAEVPSAGLGASMGEVLFVLGALVITGFAAFRMKIANS